MNKTVEILDYLCKKVDKMRPSRDYEISQEADKWLMLTYWDELHDYISPDSLTFSEDFKSIRRDFSKRNSVSNTE